MKRKKKFIIGIEKCFRLTWRPSISSDKTRMCWTALASEKRSRGASIPRGLTNFMWRIGWTSIVMRPYMIAKANKNLNPEISPLLNLIRAIFLFFWFSAPRERERERLNHNENTEREQGFFIVICSDLIMEREERVRKRKKGWQSE